METFNNYKIASIDEANKSKFTDLENTLSKENNKDIVVIAYEKK